MVNNFTKISTISNFIKKLANITIEIRDQVKIELKKKSKNVFFQKLFTNFKKTIPNLNVESFADIFAQTLTYIFFSIKVLQKNKFNIEKFPMIISNTNLILKIYFDQSLKMPELKISSVIKLSQIMKVIDIDEILNDFKRKEGERDPINHFYELFLKEYDPDQKINRGVFYTPNPIASFIVRSVNKLLQTEYNYTDGLADTCLTSIITKNNPRNPVIQILDPATGTGTFLVHIINQIKQIFDKKYRHLEKIQIKKQWNEYVSTHLLPRLIGYEVMSAPHAVANLKLGIKLIETGYDFNSNQGIRIYLKNTLKAPNEINNPISIVIGNPPYMVNSINDTSFIQNLMQLYKEDVKNEKYIKPLSDDYIKFIRFAHYLINKTGFGIIGMVTNHGYLSGLIHRGMRNALIQSFDKIYILDLHGNSNIGEICPDDSEDQNVFDIQQGVAISIFIKLPTRLSRPEVYHFDLWGNREHKYQYLKTNDVSTIHWNTIIPNPPNYFFIPCDTRLSDEYNSFPSVKDIFKLHRIGILTNRDWLTVDFSFEELKQKIQRFFKLLDKPEFLDIFPKLKNTWWDYNKLKKLNIQIVIKSITRCLFRPFDIRYITYHPLLLNRARTEIMDHINGKKNLVLILSRHYRKDSFNSCFISEYIVEQKAGESTRGSYIFPLYLYLNGQRHLNLTPLAKHCFKNLITQSDEIAIIGYIYAILHSNGYRKRYKEYLKLDFPKIPITKNEKLFERLADLGKNLISFHLLEQNVKLNIKFQGIGNNQIKKGFPKFLHNSIYINETQSFLEISPEVWTFTIGGYPVCQKWLKDRKGRILDDFNIIYYQKIIHAIINTIRITNTIDRIIEAHGGWALK